MNKELKDVGIWIRVSTEDQARGESPEHHEQRAKMYAQLKGWNVQEVYHLEAVSGKSVMEHPEAKRMMQDIRSGRISGLIFSKLARLARNTKELLEFAEYFKEHGADLISLQESIDTSSPAGKLLYTMIAALAEWEREEIASRVRASVPIRAKMGKSLGGAAPYGYQWVDKELKLEPKESEIRKIIFDLFLKHKRKQRVANILNERGYRTRKGSKFSNTTLERLLRAPIAKGMRRMNYTQSRGNGKSWDFKSQDDWIFTKAPAIVSADVWDECNRILDELRSKNKRVGRSISYLFTGYIQCQCGGKMYGIDKLKKYSCRKCKNKIPLDVMEEVFTSQIENFLFSEDDIQRELDKNAQRITEKEREVIRLQQEVQEIEKKIKEILELYHQGIIKITNFKSYHDEPVNRKEQILEYLPNLQGEIDAMKVNRLSSDRVLQDARNLQKQWKSLDFKKKRSIIENVLTNIIVGDKDIDINLAYLPTTRDAHTSPEKSEKGKRNLRDS